MRRGHLHGPLDRSRGSSGRHKRGQSLTELALMAPVFFLMMMAAFDFSLAMFSIGSARFGVADAARIEGQVGNSPGRNACDATCKRLGIGQGVNGTDCDADCQAIVSLNKSPRMTSSLARVFEVDVIKETVSGGTLSDSTTVSKYRADGGPCNQFTVTYPNNQTRTFCVTTGITAYATSSRNVIFGQTDTLKLDVVYEYPWKTGVVSALIPVPPLLHASYVVNLEPEGYR
jgi:Flp pilus assembly protein TadG